MDSGASSLEDLVDAGILTQQELDEMQSTAPPGAQWGIDDKTGLATVVYL